MGNGGGSRGGFAVGLNGGVMGVKIGFPILGRVRS